MKKILTFLLILITIIGLMAGCGKTNDDPSAPPAPDFDGDGDIVHSESLLGDFTTTDIYGNAVDQTIFQNTTLTMINVWGTFCSPCINEMPDLGELNRAYDAGQFQIIGIVTDVLNRDGSYNDDQIAQAVKIATDTGADYTHLLPSPGGINDLLADVYGVPTTYFVDSQGELVGEAVMGSQSKEDWQAIIDERLLAVAE